MTVPPSLIALYGFVIFIDRRAALLARDAGSDCRACRFSGVLARDQDAFGLPT